MLLCFMKKEKIIHDCTYIGTFAMFLHLRSGKVVSLCHSEELRALYYQISIDDLLLLLSLSVTNKILCCSNISVVVTNKITVSSVTLLDQTNEPTTH